ncbi:MAG: ATP synthase F1 subunit epsilon [Proteobacteria bacterium]|nr:ATP synthase F1 subunit epsilon [Pseudomonadota bacterium]
MGTDSFQLKVVTPAGIALEEEVTTASLPTVQGEIGVLPQHIGYNGLLGVGVLSYCKVGSTQFDKVVVSGGFCQFGDSTLTILADTVDLPGTIDSAKYGAERAELQKIIEVEDSQSQQWQVAKEQLARIEAIDRLIA